LDTWPAGQVASQRPGRAGARVAPQWPRQAGRGETRTSFVETAGVYTSNLRVCSKKSTDFKVKANIRYVVILKHDC